MASASAKASTRGKMKVADTHYVLKGNQITPPFPKGIQSCVFGTGCFWGSEKGFWRLPGVYSTAVGYIAGTTKNPTYKEVCSGRTNHNEVVQVTWDPKLVSFADILRQFWQSHDPSQGMRQGNDRGTQYRSGIYTATDAQQAIALKSRVAYQKCLKGSGKKITTEVLSDKNLPFYYAEDDHQQYLAKPGARPYCSAQPLQIALPPVSEWAPDCGLKNLLPPAYWTKYSPTPHCVIGQPNEQIRLVSLY